MKKFLLSIAIVASLLLTNVKAIELPEVTDHEKVTIYIFRGHGCSHCYDALTYFYENASKYSEYLEIKSYEVWNDSTNRDLMLDVAESLGDEASGVPYIVIGDSYSTAGFGTKTGEELVEKALEEYQNKKYKDIVAKYAKKGEYNAETLAEACEQEGIPDTTETSNQKSTSSGKYDGWIITGILIVVLGGTAALILSNRKQY